MAHEELSDIIESVGLTANLARIILRYADDSEEEVSVPIKWEICGTCRGEGKSSAYLGAFTSDEWAQEDEDFKVDYVRGEYDRTCETCNGRTSVPVVDEDAMPEHLRKLYAEAVEEDISYRQMCEMERRMGA